jgi:hypothetical protein
MRWVVVIVIEYRSNKGASGGVVVNCSRRTWSGRCRGPVRVPCGLLPQRGPHLDLHGGELRAVVRADDSRVGRPAEFGVTDQIGDAPAGAEAVTANLLDLGVQGGQPRPPTEREQHVPLGGELVPVVSD